MAPDRMGPVSPAMTPRRWQQIEPLMKAALQREPDERSKFLAEACGDNAAQTLVPSAIHLPHSAGADRLENAVVAEFPEVDWIALREGQMVWWSPDGNAIYGQLQRDGHLCIWAHRLHPSTKPPLGGPFPVFHSHGSRRSFGNQQHPHPFIGKDGIAFSMGERTGNIWLTEFR